MNKRILTKIQHPFMIKTQMFGYTQKVGREGTYLKIIEAKCNKLSGNIISNKKLKAFPLRSGTRLTLSFKFIPATEIIFKKSNKRSPI